MAFRIKFKQQQQNQPWRKAFRNSCNVVLVFEKAIMWVLASLGLAIVLLRPDCQIPGRAVGVSTPEPIRGLQGTGVKLFTLCVLPNVQASWNGWHGKFRVVVPGFDVTCLVFSGAKIAYGSITSRNHKIPAQLSPLWRNCQEPLEDVTAGFVSPVHRRLEKDFSLCSYSQTHAHVCYSVWLALAGWVEGWPYTQLSSPWLF